MGADGCGIDGTGAWWHSHQRQAVWGPAPAVSATPVSLRGLVRRAMLARVKSPPNRIDTAEVSAHQVSGANSAAGAVRTAAELEVRIHRGRERAGDPLHVVSRWISSAGVLRIAAWVSRSFPGVEGTGGVDILAVRRSRRAGLPVASSLQLAPPHRPRPQLATAVNVHFTVGREIPG